MLVDKNQLDLIKRFKLEGFSMNVLSVKRTLVEKMLGVIKDSYDDDPILRLSGRIRHLYDICLILREAEYRHFVQSDEFKPLCDLCIEDDKSGILQDSDYLKKPVIEAPLFSEFSNWHKSLDATYKGTFSGLVYGELPDMDEIAATFDFIKENL